ncbi:hypothetical protein KEJ13_03310 [Candidatus Bathyarchaeota archaeon]|nr:hypothetical protein [Candidatus Bathyarchaeota archaeon]
MKLGEIESHKARKAVETIYAYGMPIARPISIVSNPVELQDHIRDSVQRSYST